MEELESGDGGERTAADLIQEKKFAERLERLAALNDVRLQESSARKSSMAATVEPRESVDLFLSSFSQKREVVEVGLALAKTKQIEPNAMKEHLENLSLEVTAMEKSTASAAFFLPASVVKASQNTVRKLREEVQFADTQLVPKKKFSFRNKGQGGGGVSSAALPSLAGKNGVPSASSSSKGVAVRGEDNSSTPGAQQSSLQQHPPGSSPAAVNRGHQIDGESNAVIVRGSQELGGELTLSNLTDCRVYLKGHLTNLVLHSLKNCKIYAGPVSGSVFIEHVESCVLVLASHQIRIHSTNSTDFYLRVRSKPIVEYTSKNRFAPYAFHYDGIQEDLKVTQLAEESGLWEKVDDFRWLRATHSPNWSVLPVEERIPVEDGPNYGDF